MLKRDPKRLFLRYIDRGDTAALGRVFDQLAPELLALALHLTRDRDAAEDALQETFLAAVDAARKFDRGRALEPWLVGILVNRARKARDDRRGRGRQVQVNDEEIERLAGSSAPPGSAAEEREARELVEGAIGQLEEPYRSVVEVHLSEGLPPRDIAPRLGRAPGTVRVQLHRGLEKLRDALRGPDGQARPEFLALSPGALTLLGEEGGRGLIAIKAQVLSAAGDAASGSTGVMVQAPSSGLFALGLAATLACTAGAWILLGRADDDLDDTLERVAAPEREVAVEEADVELARVEQRTRKEAPPVRRASAEQVARATQASPTRKAAAREPEAPAPPAAPLDPESRPFLIQAFADDGNWIGFDALSAVKVTAFDLTNEPMGSAAGLHGTLDPFSIGSFADRGDVPLFVRVRYDHPGALPADLNVTWRDWTTTTKGYVARPRFRLEPIGTRLEVRPLTGKVRDFRGERIGAGASGKVVLLAMDHDRVVIKDAAPISPAKDRVHLRSRSDVGTRHVMVVPDRPGTAACLIETSIDSLTRQRLGLPLFSMPYPPYRVVVLDPFGRPMAGAGVRTTVPGDRLMFKDPATDEPAEVDGWVFVQPQDPEARLYAGLLDPNTPRHEKDRSRKARGSNVPPFGRSAVPLDLVPVRKIIEGETDEKGQFPITGALKGAHVIEVRSPLEPEVWDKADSGGFGRRTFAYHEAETIDLEVQAPVAGLLIERPEGLASGLEGALPADLWRTAKITVESEVGPPFRGEGSVSNASHAMALVPILRLLRVKVEVAGRRYEVSTMSKGPGQSHLVVPLRVKADEASAEASRDR